MAIDPARAKSLFLAAAERADPAERAVFLDHECGGDAELRARVEALLRADAGVPVPAKSRGTATIDPVPSQPETRTFAEATAEACTLIAGRYIVEQKLGEGGMGEVWVAKQVDSVKRRVALKLVKPGMDSRAVLQRFEQERQALALMDHPNIARVPTEEPARNKMGSTEFTKEPSMP